MNAIKWTVGLLLLMTITGTLSAQTATPADTPAGQDSPADFGMGASIGTILIDGVTYQSLSLIPDLALGPIGVGLDIKLNYQFYRFGGDTMGIYLRSQDWIVDKDNDAVPDSDGTIQEYADLYLSKIVYLRYGTKGQPLYAKIGLFEDGKLGNGFIMGNYSNGLLRPEISYVGLALDVDGGLFNFPVVGMESFTNSISGWDILGGRLYTRPLKLLGDIPVFGDLQIGFTAVADRDPYAIYRRIVNPTTPLEQAAKDQELQDFDGNQVVVMGVDFRQPLANVPNFFSLSLFGDYVHQSAAQGGMVGLGGNFLFLNYNGQIRMLGENFLPVYFDRSYDLSRVSKLKTYLNEPGSTVPGFNGWYFQMGTNLLDGQVAFSSSIEGPLGAVDGAGENDTAVWPKLRSSLVLDGTKLLPVPIALKGYYDKDLIKDLSTLFSPENALIGAQLSYKMGVATLNLVYNLRYTPLEQQVPGTDPWVVTSKLETVISLF